MASSHWTMPWQWWAIKRRGLSVAGCHGWYFHRFVAVRGWFQGNWCQGRGRGLSCPVIHVQRILSWWDNVREQCHLQTSWAPGNWGNMGVKELECQLIVELLDLSGPPCSEVPYKLDVSSVSSKWWFQYISSCLPDNCSWMCRLMLMMLKLIWKEVYL